MENKLSISEIRYIRSLVAHKTDKQLAEMVGKPVELITLQLSLMSGLPKRPDEKKVAQATIPTSSPTRLKPPKKEKVRSSAKKRISHAERKVLREKKKVDKIKEQREKQSLHIQEEARVKERSKRLARGKFKTRVLDLTGTIRVMLNAKTTVWVKPDTDIEQLKKKYNIR